MRTPQPDKESDLQRRQVLAPCHCHFSGSQNLSDLEAFVSDSCTWVRELCLILSSRKDSFSPELIAQCRASLLTQRQALAELPGQLLGLGLDISGIMSRIAEFESRIEDFQRLADSLEKR